jgi:hypothetical protein
VRYLACLCLAGLAWAQGSEPRASASDYEVHAAGLGAEYMVYSVSGQGKTFLVPDHLVVEVALYPRKGGTVSAAAADFTLRVDGKTLRAVAPQTVVSAMERRQWMQPRGVQATAGRGGDVVIVGGPQRQPPYGGVPRRTPAPPRAPEPENRSGLPPAEPVRAEELVVNTAFPEGVFKGPVSGYLYFPFTGRASRVRRVQLLYGGVSLELK